MTATLTPRGLATRARIVAAAAELIAAHGVAGTGLDDVRRATATSKSQLYHYFEDKADLVRAVIAHQLDAVLTEQHLCTDPLDSVAALQRWRYRTLAAHRATGFARGCPLGRLAAELVDADPQSRAAIAAALAQWQQQLAAGLIRMAERGTLPPEADPEQLASGLLAALQGGALLATATRSPKPLQTALDLAIQQIEALTATTT
jgi:AcrR family transcriptional regulator